VIKRFSWGAAGKCLLPGGLDGWIAVTMLLGDPLIGQIVAVHENAKLTEVD
jgi:hypothetical protein